MGQLILPMSNPIRPATATAPHGFFLNSQLDVALKRCKFVLRTCCRLGQAVARRSHRANRLISPCRHLILGEVGDLLSQLADFIPQPGEIEGGDGVDSPVTASLALPTADRAFPAASSE